MSIGIWAPVVLSGKQVVFPDRLNNFAAKLQQVTLVAGTHMRFTIIGECPVYIHTTAPADDTAGLTGNPIDDDSSVVMPRVSPIWIYSPYENTTVLVDVGTMT